MPTDPNDPSSFIDSAGKSVDQANGMLEKMRDILKPIYDSLNKVFSKETSDKVGGLTKTFQSFDAGLLTLKQNIGDTYDNINKFPDIRRGTTDFMNGIDTITSGISKLGAFVSNAHMFDDFSKDSMDHINDVSQSIDSMQQSLKRVGINININTPLIQNAVQAEKLETAYMRLAAQSGNLNTVFGGIGDRLQDVGAISGEYANKIGLIASANGQSVKSALNLSSAIDKIPGSMSQVIITGSGAGAGMQKLDAAFKLISGSGMSQSDMVKTLSFAYENLSASQGKIVDSSQKGMEMFALISQVSNVLQVDLNDVRHTMEGIATDFSRVGNETDASAKILGRYTSALRETGLTAKASMDIIRGMTHSISQMEMGTKAFLSLRSGGPGGLQGAFKIEQLLRDGKLDQVMQMAERSLKQQMGGRIYSLQEAARDPGAAAQFMRQREMVKSGAFGIGKGLDDAGATRLLEALGKGNIGNAANRDELQQLVSGQSALAKVTDRGTQWEERQFNEIKRVSIATERAAIASEIQAGILLKSAIGSLREQPLKDANAAQMRSDTRSANIAGERQSSMSGATTPDMIAQTALMTFKGATKSMFDAADSGIKGFSGFIAKEYTDIAGSITGSGMKAEIADEMARKKQVAQRATQNGSVDRNSQSIKQDVSQQARDTVAALSQDKKAMEPQKIVLEIISDGNQVKIISKPDNIAVSQSAQNAIVANPGY
jgi:hypothetical protein